MAESIAATHWDRVYASRAANEVSWFEATPSVSLELIARCGQPSSSVIDIGGGESLLVDALLAGDRRDVTVLDISAKALAAVRERLGDRAGEVNWIVADITRWTPERRYEIWHDRAVLHFLDDPADQASYVRALDAALSPSGVAIIGTFAPDGPEQCSGLPVTRHDAGSLGRLLGKRFRLLSTTRADHRTPWDTIQHFQFSLFGREARRGDIGDHRTSG
jgi:SAM-dependent methyltransferase